MTLNQIKAFAKSNIDARVFPILSTPRSKAGWNGGDWVKIIDTHNQFSSMTIVGDTQTVLYLDSPRTTSIASTSSKEARAVGLKVN